MYKSCTITAYKGIERKTLLTYFLLTNDSVTLKQAANNILPPPKKTKPLRQRPSTVYLQAKSVNNMPKCCEINSLSTSNSKWTAVEETDKSAIVRKCTLYVCVSVCVCELKGRGRNERDECVPQRTVFNCVFKNKIWRHQLCPLTYRMFCIR